MEFISFRKHLDTECLFEQSKLTGPKQPELDAEGFSKMRGANFGMKTIPNNDTLLKKNMPVMRGSLILTLKRYPPDPPPPGSLY